MEGQGLEIQSPTNPESRVAEAATPSPAPVLVAVDLSPDSEAALIWAYGYAKRIVAPLEILHVVHDPADSPGTYKPNNGDLLEPMLDVAHGKLAEFLEWVGRDNPDLPDLRSVRSLCTPGLPGSTILRVAQDHGAQHLVLGTRRRTNLARVLHGSTANRVAGHARIPVTIVKVDG